MGSSGSATQVETCVNRYASRDATGRVWGMPSAFGKGQCSDCPKLAAPPSLRCVECQLGAARGEPMSSIDLETLRQAIACVLSENTNSTQHGPIHVSLDSLYAKLASGQISGPIQQKLMAITKAVHAKDPVAANQQLAALSSQHWEKQHKDWILCLRRVFSKR